MNRRWHLEGIVPIKLGKRWIFARVQKAVYGTFKTFPCGANLLWSRGRKKCGAAIAIG